MAKHERAQRPSQKWADQVATRAMALLGTDIPAAHDALVLNLMRLAWERRYGIPLLATTVHRRVAYEYAIALGLPVTKFAPTDGASFEIRSLLQELGLAAFTPAEKATWHLGYHRLTRAEGQGLHQAWAEAREEMWCSIHPALPVFIGG